MSTEISGLTLERDIASLAVRPVYLHRIRPTWHLGNYAPTKEEWEKKSPQRLGESLRKFISLGGELAVSADEGSGIPRRGETFTWFFGVAYVKSLGGPLVANADIIGVQDIDFRDGRILPLIKLAEDGNPDVKHALVVTLPDLAHHLQQHAVTLNVHAPQEV